MLLIDKLCSSGMSKLQYYAQQQAGASEPPINLPSINIWGTVVALVTARKERLVTSYPRQFPNLCSFNIALARAQKDNPPS